MTILDSRSRILLFQLTHCLKVIGRFVMMGVRLTSQNCSLYGPIRPRVIAMWTMV
jgi:hypothetical protein